MATSDGRQVGVKPRIQVALKGRRVALTPLMVRDVPILFRWINERDQVRFNGPYRPVTEREHAAWFEEIQKQRRDTVIFGIRLLSSGRLIGSCQLHSISPVHRSAELQIRIGEAKERGRGYGTEAVRLLLDFGFRDLNLHRIHLHVWATNEVALKMYERLGFVREGVLRRAAYIDGDYLDVVVMGILLEEHLSQ